MRFRVCDIPLTKMMGNGFDPRSLEPEVGANRPVIPIEDIELPPLRINEKKKDGNECVNTFVSYDQTLREYCTPQI